MSVSKHSNESATFSKKEVGTRNPGVLFCFCFFTGTFSVHLTPLSVEFLNNKVLSMAYGAKNKGKTKLMKLDALRHCKKTGVRHFLRKGRETLLLFFVHSGTRECF